MAGEASRTFYNEFFRLAPDARALFPDDLERQREKFIRMLEVMVKSLHRVSDISDDIIDLGRRHMAYEVEDEHYDAFGKALLGMVGKTLGTAMTPQISDAWSAAHTMLTTLMREVASAPSEQANFYARVIRDAMTAHYGLTPPEARRARPMLTEDTGRGKVISLS
jgi:hemoglobin-like flavoprotein